jgi:methylated-DNA-[protein]-cysteine S-methyltransferase
MPIQQSFYQSPIGILEIKATDENIKSVCFTNTVKSCRPEISPSDIIPSNHRLLVACKTQLDEYFKGQRTKFELPLHQEGSLFQQQVWAALTAIPFGRTISYLELSKRIGNTKAIRAVGTANGNNTISIIVPCHRVIGSNGDLTGYSGDLWRKKWLLEHEGKYANGVQTLF